MEDHDEVLLEVARLIWRREMTIGEFYEALGVDLDDLQHSNTGDIVTELSGMFKAWKNPPTE